MWYNVLKEPKLEPLLTQRIPSAGGCIDVCSHPSNHVTFLVVLDGRIGRREGVDVRRLKTGDNGVARVKPNLKL